MGGLLAKTYANYRQRRYRRWKLQVCFTKFGTLSKNNTSVGWAQNEEAQLVNLRMIVPSYYLRPHTQHALAIKKCNTTQDPDYFSLIEGIIRVKLSDAISWLGESHTFSIGCIFPSPCLDGGLRKLLSLKAFSDDLEIPTP